MALDLIFQNLRQISCFFSKFTSNFIIFNGIYFVLINFINSQNFTLEENPWGHFLAIKTNNISSFNDFSSTGPIIDLNVSLVGLAKT